MLNYKLSNEHLEMKTLDWYIIKKFLVTFFYSISLFIVIAIVFDITEKLEDFIQNKVEKLVQVVLKTISDSGIKTSDIDSIFFTGGSTQIPMIRSAILAHFPNAEVVQGDVFSSVGKGLIIDAIKQWGQI